MTKVSSLYLHIPFCKHLCNYCDFYKKLYDPSLNQIEDFHQFLQNSWIRHEELFEKYSCHFSPLSTLYFGGGTPSLWGTKGAKFFEEWFRSKIILAPNCEFTMEVDPGTWNKEMICAWRDLGMNRISIGTQTLNPNFLKIMDRSHNLEETFELLKYCHDEKINFSLDFLLGLPYSKEKQRDIISELERLLEYSPKHVSLYILNSRQKYPHAQSLPDDQFIHDEYMLVANFLMKKGFNHYEVSNFALPGFESRHNMKYWSGQAVAALGPTGTGYLPISKHCAVRYKWKVIKADFELETLGASEIELESTYLGLRTNEGWAPELITSELKSLFANWESRKLGVFLEGKMKLNSRGFIILDSLMDELFRLDGP